MSSHPGELENFPQRLTAHADGEARVYMAAGNVIQTNYAQFASVSVTRALPRDVGSFVGRQNELRHLQACLTPAVGPAIHAVTGMPGVGKTTLATRVAYLLADRFPDGQLFVRLHAHTPDQQPADPADVLAALLSITGTPLTAVPAGLDARAALWRDRASSKKLMLILDDARDSTQVEPLLPATAGCLAIITSRRRLIALEGAVHLALDTLLPDQAMQLFTRAARREAAAEADTAALGEAVRLCGYLPLAIALLGARLVQHPAWTLSQFTRSFVQTHDRLEDLAGEDRAVAAAFELSYRDLPSDRQRMFRLLGLFPGTEFDAYTVASLAAVPVDAARRHIESLYTDSLVIESAPGRYRLHDLLRAYAQHLVADDTAEARGAAVERLYDYYQQVCETTDHHFVRYTRSSIQPSSQAPSDLPDVTTYDKAIMWMRTELPNLLACAHYSAPHHQDAHTVRLTSALASFLRHSGSWQLAASLHHAAAEAARRSNDLRGASDALHDEGRVLRLTGEFTGAAAAQEQARSLYQALGNRQGEANALRELGRLHHATGDPATGAGFLQRALVLHRDLGDRRGQANALRELGRIHQTAGAVAEAVALLEQAVAIYQDINSLRGRAQTLVCMGALKAEMGAPSEGRQACEQAAMLARQAGSTLVEARALETLADIAVCEGRISAAQSYLQQAVDSYISLGVAEAAHAQQRLADLADLRS